MEKQEDLRIKRLVQGRTEQPKTPNVGIQKDKWRYDRMFNIINIYYDENVSSYLYLHDNRLPNASKTQDHSKKLLKRRLACVRC